MDADTELLRRQDDYERGRLTARIESLQQVASQIMQDLKDHRHEERDTWEVFEGKLATVQSAIDDLKLWRAKMMAIAGVVSFIVTSLWSVALAYFKPWR